MTMVLKSGDRLAIDPGNIGSGWIAWRPDADALGGMQILGNGRDRNIDIRKALGAQNKITAKCHLQIESPKPRGMPTSAEEMEMMIQLGRILQMWRGPWTYVFRQPIKIHICGSNKAKDGNVSQAIKDRFGGDSVAIGGKNCTGCKGKKLIGTRHCPKCKKASQKDNDCGHCSGGKNKAVYKKLKCPQCRGLGVQSKAGPLKGIAEHEWAALAAALYWMDTGDKDVRQIAGQQNVTGQQKKWAKKGTTSKGVPQ